MRIDAIIQSCDYADMLAVTLPLNRPSFDNVLVYTKPGDTATKEVCAANGVECIETDGFTANGSVFNRGYVYNEAFRYTLLGSRGSGRGVPPWLCIIDSDIVLPHDWRAQFEALPPNYEYFYGVRRYNVETAEQWRAIQADSDQLRNVTCFRGYGYGYLQIFSPLSSTFQRLWVETQGNVYPEWIDGSTADWKLRNAWGDAPWNPPTQPPDHILDHAAPEPCDPPTGLLRQLPFNVVHLGISGMNATGRHTPLWTIPIQP